MGEVLLCSLQDFKDFNHKIHHLFNDTMKIIPIYMHNNA